MYTTNDDQLMNKRINFVEIKFNLNETLNDILVCKLKWIEIELKLNSIEFNWIQI
jgi:hypothetical protein